MMKNIIEKFQICLVLSALLFSSFVAACSGNDDTVTPEITIPANILTDGMTFSKTGGTSTLNIKSNVALEVTSSAPEWCKVTAESSASSSILKYTVMAEANTDTSDREAKVTVKAGGSEVGSFTVKQTAADGLIISNSTSFDLPAAGGDVSVVVETNGDVQAVSDVSWIKAVNTRAMEDKIFKFTVSPNPLGAREGHISFTLGSLTETVAVKQGAGETGNMESDARTLAAKMYAGINIGNTLEACDNKNKIASETLWGNPKVSEAYIKGLKALGFNTVRIPCAWDYYIVNPSTYEIDAAWLDRVSEVVGYCVANDMYAIVNIHWDGGWLEESITHGYSSEVDAKQKAIWTQIANKLNAYDEHLLFAGCNEPGQQDQGNVGTSAIDVILKYEQTFIDAVRATGGNNASRCLIVQGPYTNIDKTVNDYTMPKDEVPDRLMVEVHFYDPYQFTMMNHDETWSNVFLYWGKDNHVSGSIHNATGYEEDYVKQQFQKMKTAYADKGIPVIVGEYSAMKRAKEDKIEGTSELAYPDIDQEMHNKSRSYWNEVVTREAKNHGCVPFYWETGGDMNRGTGTAKEAYAIEGIMKGAAAGQYPY